jgi:ketosteroid isomerase-like protein
MSPKSSDVVREQFEAFELGGVEAIAEFWHPEIEWRAVEGAADDVGTMCGHDALRRYYQDWIDTLEDLRAEVGEVFLEDDDRVAVVVHHSGRGRASGVQTEGRYYVACIVREGQIVAGREFATRQEALEAAPAAAAKPDVPTGARAALASQDLQPSVGPTDVDLLSEGDRDE